MPSLIKIIPKLLQELVETKQLDQLNADIIFLKDTNGCGDMDLILDDPQKTAGQKTLYVQKIIDTLTYSRLKYFFQQVLNLGELKEFKDDNLSLFVEELSKKLKDYQIVRLTVALDFNKKDLKEMADEAAKKIGTPVVFNLTIDKSLMGGAIIQFGNYLLDHSLKTKLDNFQENWQESIKNTDEKV